MPARLPAHALYIAAPAARLRSARTREEEMGEKEEMSGRASQNRRWSVKSRRKREKSA